MTDFAKRRADTRKATTMIRDLAVSHDIKISGFMRDKNNQSIVGCLIEFVPPIKESDLE